jgi:membrane-associated phospholipid phosphatase
VSSSRTRPFLLTGTPATRLAFAAVAGAIFVTLAVAVPDRGSWGFDSTVKQALDAIFPVSSEDVHPDPVLRGTVVVGTTAACLAAAWFLLRRRWREALFLVGSIGGTVALSSLTKELVKRPAIEAGPGDYSFPSGTAAWAAAVAAAAVLLVSSRRARVVVALFGAVLVLAYSAVITWEEWHYASDVVAGWCLALAWVALLGGVLLRGEAGQGRSVAAVSGAGPWGRLRPSKSEARE